MYLDTRGLVLRVTDYKEHDAILTLLTPEHGKLSAKARGLRRKNSPLTAPCQLLALGDFTLFAYRGMYTINEASSVEQFRGLRRDITSLSLGTYFAQVAEAVSQEDAPSPELLSVVLNCLFALDRLEMPQEQVKAAFEWRVACLSGYAPELRACHVCGNQNPDRLDLSAGRLECAACRHADSSGLRIPLNPTLLAGLRYLSACEPKRLFAFTMGQDNMKKLSDCTEAYLSTQLERGFSTLDFYKSLWV